MADMHSTTDWDSWHAGYDDPSSLLSERLRLIQRHIADWLDASAPASVTVVSSCAGDGRDLLGVLEGRSDANRVTATLIEADPRNAARAKDHVSRLGLSNIEVRHADAGNSDAYLGAVPADLVLFCGVFGNITDDDVHRTITAIPQLCNEDAVVMWTRHRLAPDLTPRIRGWFHELGFEETHFEAPSTRSTRLVCTASPATAVPCTPRNTCSRSSGDGLRPPPDSLRQHRSRST